MNRFCSVGTHEHRGVRGPYAQVDREEFGVEIGALRRELARAAKFRMKERRVELFRLVTGRRSS